MTAAAASLRAALAPAATDARPVGTLLWFSLVQCEVAIPTFRAFVAAEGLDVDMLPQPPGPAKCLRLAVREVLPPSTEGRFARLAAETSTETIWALFVESKDGAGKVDARQVARFAVDGAGAFTTDAPSDPTVATIRAAFERLSANYTDADVRAFISRNLKAAHAVSLKETGGGVYWSPPVDDRMTRLAAAINKIGGSQFDLLPVFSSEVGDASLGRAARGSVEAELADLRAEFARFEEEAPRPSTLANRLATFEALRARANLYRDVLSVEVSDLDGSIAALEARAEKMLAGLDAE